MTWIETVPKSKADAALKAALDAQHALYPKEYEAGVAELPDDDGAGIVSAHSLLPDAMRHAFSTFGALMSPDLPLSRKDHELIATVVSQSNCTFYCSTAHREFLRRATGDSNLVESVKADWRSAELTERERTMLEYAEQVALDATQIGPENHERLHAVGFDDKAILQATMIAAWFCYINRMADALGVGR